jgi:hypothetical protein
MTTPQVSVDDLALLLRIHRDNEVYGSATGPVKCLVASLSSKGMAIVKGALDGASNADPAHQ